MVGGGEHARGDLEDLYCQMIFSGLLYRLLDMDKIQIVISDYVRLYQGSIKTELERNYELSRMRDGVI